MWNFKWQPVSSGINFKTLGNKKIDNMSAIQGGSFGLLPGQPGNISAFNEASSK